MSHNWQKYRLDEISIISMGQSPPSEFYNERGDGLPFFQGKTEFGEYYPLVKQFTSKTTKRAFKKDILMTVRAPVGELNIANQDCCIGRGLGAIRAKNKNEDRFLYYILKINTELFLSRSNGAIYDAINSNDLRSSEVFIPKDSSERLFIANILSNYDDLIQVNLKRINLLEEFLKITYEDWFFRFRVEGEDLLIDNATGLPTGWNKKAINKFNSFKQDCSKLQKFSGDKIYYATADIEGTLIKGEGEIVNWDNKPSRAQIEPKNNTVWFARMSDTYKVLCFNSKNLDQQQKIILSSGFVGFRAKNDLSLPFLYLTINSKFFHEIKDLYATGATQVALNNDSLNFIKIIEPDIKLIEKFGLKTLHLLEEITNLRKKNILLREARDVLLPRLMTGLIDTNKLSVLK